MNMPREAYECKHSFVDAAGVRRVLAGGGCKAGLLAVMVCDHRGRAADARSAVKAGLPGAACLENGMTHCELRQPWDPPY